MSQLLISILAFIVALGILVTIHEFGHFWVARRMGVKVLRFSVGFGRPLWSWQGGAPDETEYCVAAIPLGGYVRMLDEREAEVSPGEQDRAFNRQPLGPRTLIVLAGPAANFLFAVVAYWALFVVGVDGVRPMIGAVTPESYAEQAGFAQGDEIVAVDGRRTATWQEASLALVRGAMNRDTVVVRVRTGEGDSATRRLELAGAGDLTAGGQLLARLGLEPWRPAVPAQVADVQSGSPAERAGLQSGDRILTAAGDSVAHWQSWVEVVQAHPGEPVEVEVERRDGSRATLTVEPEAVEGEDGPVGRIGAYAHFPDDALERVRTTVRHGPLEAAVAGTVKTWEMTTLTLRFLWGMVRGDAALTNLSGPVGIAHYAGQSASLGLTTFLSFLAIVSISLGIINLLPIPMLDGGHLMYFAAEFVKGSPVSEEAQAMGQRIGLMMLLGLMVLAFYSDFVRLFGA